MVLFCFLVWEEAGGQESRQFADPGVVELGGSISFSSITPVYAGETGDAVTLLTFRPVIGVFVIDGLELGLNPLGITYISTSGASSTALSFLFAASYNFRTEGSAYPFLEAILGFTSSSNGDDRSGFTWGGRAGAKFVVTEGGLLNVGIQYLLVTRNPDVATERYGTNELSIALGFTVFL
jgi:hypothetical protein